MVNCVCILKLAGCIRGLNKVEVGKGNLGKLKETFLTCLLLKYITDYQLPQISADIHRNLTAQVTACAGKLSRNSQMF